jgi:hypothetical protein
VLFMAVVGELTVALWRAMASSNFVVSSNCESSCEPLLESKSWKALDDILDVGCWVFG